MSKRNVRVEIPISSPDKLLKLVSKIIEKSEEMAADSPLSDMPMNKVKQQNKVASDKRSQSEKLRAQSVAANQQSRIAMGNAKGQTINSKDTLYFLVALIRDQLLVTFKGREEMLEEFGFKVVISTSARSGSSTEEGAGDGTSPE